LPLGVRFSLPRVRASMRINLGAHARTHTHNLCMTCTGLSDTQPY
jgi:hypothetical protein